MSSQPLAPEQEAQSRRWGARLRPHVEEDPLALVRVSWSARKDRELFGETEFEACATWCIDWGQGLFHAPGG